MHDDRRPLAVVMRGDLAPGCGVHGGDAMNALRLWTCQGLNSTSEVCEAKKIIIVVPPPSLLFVPVFWGVVRIGGVWALEVFSGPTS